MQADPSHPSGCLIALSAVARSVGSGTLHDELRGEREANRSAIRACVDRAIAGGELRADTDPVALGALFEALLVGFAIEARDGVPEASMQAAITGALGAWDAFSRSAPAPAT